MVELATMTDLVFFVEFVSISSFILSLTAMDFFTEFNVGILLSASKSSDEGLIISPVFLDAETRLDTF